MAHNIRWRGLRRGQEYLSASEISLFITLPHRSAEEARLKLSEALESKTKEVDAALREAEVMKRKSAQRGRYVPGVLYSTSVVEYARSKGREASHSSSLVRRNTCSSSSRWKVCFPRDISNFGVTCTVRCLSHVAMPAAVIGACLYVHRCLCAVNSWRTPTYRCCVRFLYGVLTYAHGCTNLGRKKTGLFKDRVTSCGSGLTG